jgi:uncharacterized protein (DUF1330 family)
MTAKGYWIARVDVTDMDAYRAYTIANAEPFGKYGARFIVRAGEFQVVEGEARARNVVIEFPSYQAALDCWNSPEYAKAKALREGAGVGDIVVIEGYEGPQPGA